MFWLQLAAALGRGAAAGTTGIAPAGEIVILYQDKDYEVAYSATGASRSLAILRNRAQSVPGGLEAGVRRR